MVSRIRTTGRVIEIQSPLDPRFANQVFATRHAARPQFRIPAELPTCISATAEMAVVSAVAQCWRCPKPFLLT
jgi:hypothetical protein